MRPPLVDHDIKIWVDAQTYLALQASAKAEDRSVSYYVRRLIAADLAEKASALHHENASGEAAQDRDMRGAVGRGGDR